jgi:hypothetical protein
MASPVHSSGVEPAGCAAMSMGSGCDRCLSYRVCILRLVGAVGVSSGLVRLVLLFVVNHYPLISPAAGDRVSGSNRHTILTGETAMVSYDDKRIPCRESYTAAKFLEQAIFATLTPETTHEQYASALATLRGLRDRFVAKLDLFHYAS